MGVQTTTIFAPESGLFNGLRRHFQPDRIRRAGVPSCGLAQAAIDATAGRVQAPAAERCHRFGFSARICRARESLELPDRPASLPDLRDHCEQQADLGFSWSKTDIWFPRSWTGIDVKRLLQTAAANVANGRASGRRPARPGGQRPGSNGSCRSFNVLPSSAEISSGGELRPDDARKEQLRGRDETRRILIGARKEHRPLERCGQRLRRLGWRSIELQSPGRPAGQQHGGEPSFAEGEKAAQLDPHRLRQRSNFGGEHPAQTHPVLEQHSLIGHRKPPNPSSTLARPPPRTDRPSRSRGAPSRSKRTALFAAAI